MLGVGGAWIAHLTAFEPLRPLFIGLTVVFLGFAYRRIYLIPQACEPGTVCVDSRTLRRQRVVFWIVSISLIVLIALPWVAPLFL